MATAFAHIAFPESRGVFLDLAALGGELIGLHLLADRRLDEPLVRVVGDTRQRLQLRRCSALVYKEDAGRLIVNGEGLCFEGISPEVLRYEIGGHQVLARWLHARCGRALLAEEIATFCRIAAALAQTREVQARIEGSGAAERRKAARILEFLREGRQFLLDARALNGGCREFNFAVPELNSSASQCIGEPAKCQIGIPNSIPRHPNSISRRLNSIPAPRIGIGGLRGRIRSPERRLRGRGEGSGA